MFELVFLSGSRAGEVVQVVKTLLAGRSPDCSLEVPDPNASRQHCRFVYDGTSLSIADNRSANGTFHNDRSITDPIVLKHDDVVRMGETRIRVQIRAQGQEAGSDSIFGFHDSEADLSQSIVVPVSEFASSKTPDALHARLQGILKATNLLKNIGQLDVVLSGILDVMFELFPQTDRGFLMLGPTVETLIPKAVKTRNPAGAAEVPKISTSICRKALNEKAAFLFNDQNPGDFDQGMSIVSLKIRSAMTVPLVVDNEVMGLMQVDTPDRARSFSQGDLELAVAVSQQAAMAVRNAQLLQQREKDAATKTNLCRFLPGPVAQQVLDGQLDLGLGGRTYQGTVLFSDVVGFTRMSEALPPEQVIALMNDYFERMVPCILGEQGSIDKFIGDAIMAFWGVPLEKGNSAHQGCLAALAMQIQLLGFNSLQAAAGKHVLGHGIGLNTGPVVAGNIGTQKATVSYTLLGDTVNTASRIEHHAMKEQVLISDACWRALKGAGFGIRMPPVSVRNKAEPLVTYALRGLASEGGEIMLFLPVLAGDQHGWLTRRLSDQSFVLLHPSGLDPASVALTSASPEWPGIALGVPSLLAGLPAQKTDGHLARSQIRLPDPTLGGLLGAEAVPCPVGWDSLVR